MREGWTYKKLGEVCSIERGGSPRPITDYITDAEYGINWIKIGDAVEGSKYIMSTAEKIKPEGMKKSRFVHKGDFILSNSMSFGKPYILGIDGCIHDGWLVIHDTFNKDFLYYYLSSPIIYSEFKRLAVGGVVNNLNSNLVRGVKVAIPPLSEQQQIVSELDLLSSVIEKQKAQIEELDKLAQSIFYDMFGDPVENEKGWEVKKLREVCSKITDGTHNSPVNDNNGSYMYITAKNIKGSGLSLNNITYVTKEVHKAIYERCNPVFGDVLYIKDGATTGIAAVNTLREEFSLLSSVALLKPGASIVNYYLKAVLNMPSEYKYIRSNMGGAAITRLTIKKIESINIPLPPLSLQQEFANKIQAIESMKAKVRQSLKESEKLFNSRMDYYFNY
jgi:type I restriction enzyme S subunit